MPTRLVLDNWTPISYKRTMGNNRSPGQSFTQPMWVGEHQRRLMAYQVLQAFLDNNARAFLPAVDENEQEQHREYGDPAMLRDTILDALLGQDQQIEVDGAADAGKDGAGQQAAQAAALQDWLRDWWDRERGQLKLIETERNAVGLGDGVYSLGWSAGKGRPRLRVWDPGFYFPVLDEGNEDDYPEKVHIAWEIDRSAQLDTAMVGRVMVRRLTWELVTTEDARSYPWNDRPANTTCLYTDASWEWDPGQTTTLDAMTDAAATYAKDDDGTELNRVDMQIDFIPVVHVPNTPAVAEHYGRSSISLVLQLLDDLAGTDTDLAAAGTTVANPILALQKSSLGTSTPTYKPGEVWEIGEGSLSMPDFSRGLDALTKYNTGLLSRLSVNSRVPEALMGRIKPSEVPSGVALQLSFGPLAGMITKMRLTRMDKYPLLLKFAWRLALAGRMSDVPRIWETSRMEFGSYLPNDLAATVELVVKLRSSVPPVISAETAIDILVAAGMNVDDAEEEVGRIESRDFAGAGELRAATGSAELAAEYLQVELPEPPELPPVPPGGPNQLPEPPPAPVPGGP